MEPPLGVGVGAELDVAGRGGVIAAPVEGHVAGVAVHGDGKGEGRVGHAVHVSSAGF